LTVLVSAGAQFQGSTRQPVDLVIVDAVEDGKVRPADQDRSLWRLDEVMARERFLRLVSAPCKRASFSVLTPNCRRRARRDCCLLLHAVGQEQAEALDGSEPCGTLAKSSCPECQEFAVLTPREGCDFAGSLFGGAAYRRPRALPLMSRSIRRAFRSGRAPRGGDLDLVDVPEVMEVARRWAQQAASRKRATPPASGR